jgi:hypothetical protein
MKPPPGYLLPDGECYTDELCCALVFYPDKVEYRRALLGSIVYLSNWLAWERDSEKRGKDAAEAWKLAVECTMECWNMKCLEDLIADVAQIRSLMETKKDCCDANVTYYPTDEPTTEIIPLVGDPPEFYGETEIADWDEWTEHVCYNAHAYVDYLISTSGQLKQAVAVSSIFIGIIAATLALLAFSGLLLPIIFAEAAAVVIGIVAYATGSTFASTADDFETNRDFIVCAILTGGSLPDAVSGALGSGADWNLFYQFVDYDSALAVIYEGGYGEQYLPSDTRDDCVCEAEARFVFNWDADLEGFPVGGLLTFLWDAGQYITTTPNSTGSWRLDRFYTWSNLASYFSFSLPVSYDQVRFKFYNHPGSGSAVRHLFNFSIWDGDDIAATSEEYDTNDFAPAEWHEIIWNLDETFYSGADGNEAFTWRQYRYSQVGGGQRLWFDDFGVYKK